MKHLLNTKKENFISFFKTNGLHVSLPIVILEFFYLVDIHSWEVDPHHDGIMFSAAVAAKEGKIPNRDFFAQYGPISPLLQGFWLKITSPSLINLKIFTCIILALTVLITQNFLKNYLGTYVSILITIAYILTGPFGLPWSSILSTFFIVLTMVLFKNAFDKPGISNSKYQIFFGSFLLGVAVFIRIHVFIFIVFIFAIFILSKFRKVALPFFSQFSLGVTLGICLVLTYLSMNNALNDYIQQCIIWAFSNYSGGPVFSKSLVFEYSWIPIIGFGHVAEFFVIKKYFSNEKFKSIFIMFVSIQSFLYVLALWIEKIPRKGEQTLRNPRILLITFAEKIHFSFIYIVVSIFILLIIYLGIRHKKMRADVYLKNTLFLTFGLSSLFQLYPFADNYHIAFIIPILILSMAFSNSFVFLNKIDIQFVLIILLMIIPALFCNYMKDKSVPRTSFSSPILKDMYGSWRTAESVDSTIKMLIKNAGSERILFDCPDGLYAASSGHYMANSEKFVSWGPTQKNTSKPHRLFVCYADQAEINNFKKLGWIEVARTYWHPMDITAKGHYWNVLFAKNP